MIQIGQRNTKKESYSCPCDWDFKTLNKRSGRVSFVNLREKTADYNKSWANSTQGAFA